MTALAIALITPYSKEAHAHKVNMFAYAEGTTIFVEGYFADGRKAQNSTVSVYDSTGTELLKGTTDDNGQFTFPIPKKTDLRIVLNAGLGHQTEYRLPAGELASVADSGIAPEAKDGAGNLAASKTSPAPAGRNTAADNAKPKPAAEPSASQAVQPNALSEAQLNQMVERAVGHAIQPLMRSISEMREEKSLGTIVGGIGYIFGAMGIFFYLKARNQKR